jgi:hypothetical protein
LTPGGESFDSAQDREPVENPELVEVVERLVEPFVFWRLKYSPRKDTENHGKRNINKSEFWISAGGGLISLCNSVKNPWLNNKNKNPFRINLCFLNGMPYATLK